jgi:hypothetical protein
VSSADDTTKKPLNLQYNLHLLFILENLSQYCSIVFNFCRPTGEVKPLSLTQGKDNQFITVRYPNGSPEQAHYVKPIESKDQLMRDYFQYLVAKPTTSMKTCRGCAKQLDRNTPCIHTELICIF